MFCKQTNIEQEINVWLLGVADKACFVTHTRKTAHIKAAHKPSTSKDQAKHNYQKTSSIG